MDFPRIEMLELVKKAHATQFRNNGRVPYWMHLQAVAQILEWGLDIGNEIRDGRLREELYLAALGHDLYEDTSIRREEIVERFGPRIDAWIRGMTNDGDDKDPKAYLTRLAAGPEEVRLIKIADLIENSSSCSYAIPDMGTEWTRTFFMPIATETASMLLRASFPGYPRTANQMRAQMSYQISRLRQNLAMFHSLVPAKNTPAPPYKEITAEEWAKALERTRREEERKHAELSGAGPPSAGPTPKDDTDEGRK